MARRRVTAARRARVGRRANGCCEYCKSPQRFSPDAFSIDHILPRSLSGTDDVSNLAFACQGCNNAKYDHRTGRDPTTGAVVALFNPRLDRWKDHFRWNESFTRLIGITAMGRATLTLLDLNRQPFQNLRRVLHAAGVHPVAESET